MAIHGKVAGFLVASASSVLQNVGQFATNVDFPRDSDTVEVTAFNASGGQKAYVVGNAGGSISVDGVWSSTVDGWFNGIIGVEKAYRVYPATTDSSTSSTQFIQYKGTAILNSYDISVGVDSAVTWSAEFIKTGAVTRTTTTA